MSFPDKHPGAAMILVLLAGILTFIFVVPLLMRIASWWWGYICGGTGVSCS